MVTLDTASKQRACATPKSKPVQFTGWLAEPSIGSGKENAKVKVTTFVGRKKRAISELCLKSEPSVPFMQPFCLWNGKLLADAYHPSLWDF